MDEDRIAALQREVRSGGRTQVIERFLREGLGQSAGSVVGVFCRHNGQLDAEEFDDLAEALRFLESGERAFSLSGEAVFDGERIHRGEELREMQRATFR